MGQEFRIEKLERRDLQTAWHSEEDIVPCASSAGVTGMHLYKYQHQHGSDENKFYGFTVSSHAEDACLLV